MRFALLGVLLLQEPASRLQERYGDRFKGADSRKILDAEAAIDRFLVETDSEKRSNLAAAVKETPLDVVEHLLRYGATGFTPAKPDARLKRTTTLKTAEAAFDVELQVTVPGDYDPAATTGGVPKRWPLVIGAGNYLLPASANVFNIQLPYPNLPGGYGRGSHSVRLVAQVVREMSADYPVDADRVFLTGASAMGHCCWYTAMAVPDLPAGIFTGSSMPFPSILNQGRKDEEVVLPPLGQVRHIANHWEYSKEDEGHNPAKYMEPVLARIAKLDYADLQICTKPCDLCNDPIAWMKDRVRVRYPARVFFETDEKRITRNHWIEVVDFAARPTFILQVMHEDEKVERRTMMKKPVTVDAQADRAAGRITIKADGAKRIRVYLHDEIVDLSKEIEIVVNGAGKKHKIAKSAFKMLDATRRAGNRTIPYAASVDVDVP